MRPKPERRGRWLLPLAVCAIGIGSAICLVRLGPRTMEPTHSTDVLYTKQHEEYVGRLRRIRRGKVVFMHERLGAMKLKAKDVLRIELGRSRPGGLWRTTEDIDDPTLLDAIRQAPDGAAYPEAPYVTLYEQLTVRLGTDDQVVTTRRRIQKVLKESGEWIGNTRCEYFGDSAAAHIDFGRTITADGQVFSVADSAIRDGGVHSRYEGYQNLRRKRAALKRVTPGAIVDFQVTVTEQVSEPLRPFFLDESFGGRAPVLVKTVRVIVPPDRQCSHRLLRPSGVTAEVEHLPDGSKQYTWTARNCPALTRESHMPPYRDVTPRLAMAPPTTWEEIVEAYADLLCPLHLYDGYVLERVQAITRKAKKVRDKALAVYREVSNRTRTIPVKCSAHSLLPRHVNTVFTKRFGNDLEAALLARTMFRLADLEADLCFVRAKGVGRLVEDLPSLRQFTDCLVRVRADGQTFYLRMTGNQVPLGMVYAQCQNVPGLIVARTKPELIKVPLSPAAQETMHRWVDIQIEADGVFRVAETAQYLGQRSVKIRDLRFKRPEQQKQYFQGRVVRRHPDAELLSYRLSKLADLTKPVQFWLQYRLEDYALRPSQELMAFRLPGAQWSARHVGEPTRAQPLHWSCCYLTTSHYKVTLPARWQIRHLPDSVRASCTVMAYHGNFSKGHRTFTFNERCHHKLTDAPVSEYAPYREAVRAMASVGRRWIVLEREGRAASQEGRLALPTRIR